MYYILIHIISTDEDPGLRIESFAVINLRGVSTNKTIIYINLILKGMHGMAKTTLHNVKYSVDET
jgi:hypothetical protein